MKTDAPDAATIAAYLSDQLPEPQATAFEEYCLNHPEFARKVELALRKKTNPLRPRLAMAAGLGVVMTCGLLLVMGSVWRGSLVAYRDPSGIPLQLRTGVYLEVTLGRLRGGPIATRRVVAPGNSGILALNIYPDSPAGPEGYSAVIKVDSFIGSRSVVLEKLRSSASGWLTLSLPLAQVVGHTLSVAVTADGTATDSPVPALRLQVVPATP